MPNYYEWNRALVDHFTAFAPRHTPVRLCVDDDAFLEIYTSRLGQPAVSPSLAADDFRRAIRTMCVRDTSVSLPPDGLTHDGMPRGVAFLAAMVYAAFRMVDDDHAAEHNYFTRLREFLAIPTDKPGRPYGLGGDGVPWTESLPPEAFLWFRWNRWLTERGWLPTATHGDTQFFKWINFPISQTLLRDGDCQRIRELLVSEMASNRLQPNADTERIAVFLRRSAARLPKHLRAVVRRENPLDAGRFEDVVERVHDLYLSLGTQATNGQSSANGHATRGDRFSAGIYRYEDPVEGVLEYRILPRKPHGQHGQPITVEWSGQRRELLPYGTRWFRPLGAVPLSQPLQVPVLDHPRLRYLVLPQSSFWVFVPDPASGTAWATWQRPELGKHFIVLCRPFHDPHLLGFKRAEVLEWDAVWPVTVFGEPWHEYRGCRITASNWNEVPTDAASRDLHAALEPVSRSTMHFVGGLPAPDGVGWLHRRPPAVWVCAFEDEVTVRLQSLLDAKTQFDWLLPPNDPDHPLQLPDSLPPGPYIVSAHRNRQRLCERVLEIRDWDELTAVAPDHEYHVVLPGHRLCGANLIPNAD